MFYSNRLVMNLLDNLTKEKIENKVDMVFKDIRNAKTPEEIVPLLVELSEFIDRENLTPEQLEELKGMGTRAMAKHSRMEMLNNIDSPEVKIAMSEPSRAGLLMPNSSENENEDILMLVMPVMLNR